MSATAGGSPREGWSRPSSDLVPRPTPWPAALAGGIALTMWGFIASPVMCFTGIVVFGVSLAGWIGEIRHDKRRG